MWILSNIRWNTTMRVISLIQIYEIVVDWIIFGYHKEHFFPVKVGLSPSKKMCVICFTESPSETIKNAFSLILKALFVLKIFKFLLWLFVPVEKTALYSTSYLFFEFWLVHTWFFADWRHQRAVTWLENVRQSNIRRGKKLGFQLSISKFMTSQHG